MRLTYFVRDLHAACSSVNLSKLWSNHPTPARASLSRGGMHLPPEQVEGGKSSRRAVEGDATQLLLGPRSNRRWACREPDLPARDRGHLQGKVCARKQILSPRTVQVYSPRSLTVSTRGSRENETTRAHPTGALEGLAIKSDRCGPRCQ
jgi:hypothetical protein